MTEKNKKRVLEVVWSLEMGGAERVAIALTAGMQKLGWETELLVLAGSSDDSTLFQPLWKDAESKGIKVTGLRYDGIWDRPSRKRISTFIREHKFDLVHVHNRPADWELVVLSKFIGVTAFYTRHNVSPNYKFTALTVYKLAGRISPVIIAVSNTVGKYLHEYEKLPGTKIQVIHNGIDTQVFQPATEVERNKTRSRLGIGDDDFHWFAAMRLEPPKGLRYLLAGIALLPPNPRRKICIAGDGSLAKELQLQCEELGIAEQVVWLGLRADVPELLKSADGYLCASLNEGHPIALLEAMASGVPIIAPRIEVIREVVSEQAGYLYGPQKGNMAIDHSPQDIADAIVMMEQNPELRARISQTARTHVTEQYSEDSFLAAHNKLYKQLLA